MRKLKNCYGFVSLFPGKGESKFLLRSYQELFFRSIYSLNTVVRVLTMEIYIMKSRCMFFLYKIF